MKSLRQTYKKNNKVIEEIPRPFYVNTRIY